MDDEVVDVEIMINCVGDKKVDDMMKENIKKLGGVKVEMKKNLQILN